MEKIVRIIKVLQYGAGGLTSGNLSLLFPFITL